MHPTRERPLLVVAASDGELAAWRRRLGLPSARPGRLLRSPADPSIALLATGIGLPAVDVAEGTIRGVRPAVVLHVGLAGGLRSGLAAGDLLLATGTSASVIHLPAGSLPCPLVLPPVLPIEEELTCLLRPALARLRDRLSQGALLTADRFVDRAATKTALGRAGPYLACEMEATAVRRIAEQAGARYGGIRAISDASDRDVPPDPRDDAGRLSLRRAVACVARRQAPAEFAALLAGSRRAAAALGRAIPAATDALLEGRPEGRSQAGP